MIKREIGIGFVLGLLANSLGMLFYILIFSKQDLVDTLEEAVRSDFMGTLIAAGAIVNFLPFFLFLRQNKPYRARGVLLASILAALTIAGLKLF